jgi:hypothetical protein
MTAKKDNTKTPEKTLQETALVKRGKPASQGLAKTQEHLKSIRHEISIAGAGAKIKYDVKIGTVITSDWGNTPSEMLYTLAVLMLLINGELPHYTGKEIWKWAGKQRNKRQFLAKFDVEKTFQTIDKIDYFCEAAFLRNRKKIWDYFERTAIFPVILEAVNLLRIVQIYGLRAIKPARLNGDDKCVHDDKCVQYEKGFRSGECVHYGTCRIIELIKRYEGKIYLDWKITTENFRDVIINIYRYCDVIEKLKIRDRLFELSSELYSYRFYFLRTKDTKEREERPGQIQMMNKIIEMMTNKAEQDRITLTVAIREFQVSRVTLQRAIKDGIIKTYRSKIGKSLHFVSHSEVAQHWLKR